MTSNPKESIDLDPSETSDWLESLEAVLEHSGPDRVAYLVRRLLEEAQRQGARPQLPINTDYVNTIPVEEEPAYPGDREMERRIRGIIRWNAVAMVQRANSRFDGLGGHLSSYASSANLYEVGFNHFFRGKDGDGVGDAVYFQGHASPGIYARAFLEGRIDIERVDAFRREAAQPGLPSYPHPRLMPEFWEYPTVSMGIGPINAIYQARFNRYVHDRGIKDTSGSTVWCFMGDGECDEPESLGQLRVASREGLDNLVFVINCNLQRLDGPVYGNGKIIQELEGVFHGAGWNVTKVVWGHDWDPTPRQGRRRRARATHERGGGRRVPEVHDRARLLHSRKFLRHGSALARARELPRRSGRGSAAPRRSRRFRRSTPRTTGPCTAATESPPSSWRIRSRAGPSARLSKAATAPIR